MRPPGEPLSAAHGSGEGWDELESIGASCKLKSIHWHPLYTGACTFISEANHSRWAPAHSRFERGSGARSGEVAVPTVAACLPTASRRLQKRSRVRHKPKRSRMRRRRSSEKEEEERCGTCSIGRRWPPLRHILFTHSRFHYL